jgi:hypothetical protein
LFRQSPPYVISQPHALFLCFLKIKKQDVHDRP